MEIDELNEESRSESEIKNPSATQSHAHSGKEQYRERSERVQLADAAMKTALKPYYE